MFQFKYFSIQQNHSALKVGTDAMVFGALLNAEGCKAGLDIGAGTGVLSLMVAQKNEHIHIDAIELDFGAQQDCEYNFKHSPWANRLTLISGDFLHYTFQRQYDFIFSNPPFYQNGLLSDDVQTALSKHAAFLPFEQLFSKVSELLSSDGTFWIIFPSEFAQEVIELAVKNRLFVHKRIDLAAKPQRVKRVIFSLGKMARETQHLYFLIRNEDNSYSDDYIACTKAFHGIDLSKKHT